MRNLLLRQLFFVALLLFLLGVSQTPGNAQRTLLSKSPPTITLHFDENLELNGGYTLSVVARNNNQTAISDYRVHLYLTPGLSLGTTHYPHEHYEPQWTQSLSLSAQETRNWLLPVATAKETSGWEGVALIHEEEKVSWLAVSVSSANQPLSTAAPAGNYEMPTPPQVTCAAPSEPLSTIGSAALTALNNYYGTNMRYFSEHTVCNQFPSNWIYDVPNVIVETTPLTADARHFYEVTAELLHKTKYVFTFSTLHFTTHEQAGNKNLVRTYLAPALLHLHQNTSATGPFPLIRILYADKDDGGGFDSEEEVFDDLTYLLNNEEPDKSKWRVSIAVATIGDIDLLITSPWNHSKVAVRDYREAIVGGMNWELSYLQPETIDPNQSPISHPRYDLSIHVEGDAARAAGVFLDRLWRRNIDPLFPYLSNDCRTSWQSPFFSWNDCPLESVPSYAPNNKIPDYTLPGSSHVFGLGRGHKEWLPIGDTDTSADVAVIAAFNRAEKSLFISQHRLTSTVVSVDFATDIKEAIIDATLRNVHVKIALSHPWGSVVADDPLASVYNSLIDSLYDEAIVAYAGEPDAQTLIDAALCRLQLGKFHLDYYSHPKTNQHLYLNHSKFFAVDEKAFYVGSQNLYPSGIGSSLTDFVVDLNEYGYLVDDAARTAEILAEYWEPVWIQTGQQANLHQPKYLSDGYFCSNGAVVEAEKMFLPLVRR